MSGFKGGKIPARLIAYTEENFKAIIREFNENRFKNHQFKSTENKLKLNSVLYIDAYAVATST